MPSGTTSFPMPSPAMTAMLKVFMCIKLYPFSADSNGQSALTSGAESKALTKAMIFSVLTFGQSAYSAHPRTFVAASSKVMGFAGLPLAKSAKAGRFVFLSGLAVVPFLYGGVVQGHHWLTDRQFVDAVAVAMITPGTVVITVAYIGYLVAARNILARLSCRYTARAVIQTVGEEFAVECVCARRDRRSHRGDCRRGGSSCAPLGLRSAHHSDLRCQSCRTVSLEGS